MAYIYEAKPWTRCGPFSQRNDREMYRRTKQLDNDKTCSAARLGHICKRDLCYRFVCVVYMRFCLKGRQFSKSVLTRVTIFAAQPPYKRKRLKCRWPSGFRQEKSHTQAHRHPMGTLFSRAWAVWWRNPILWTIVERLTFLEFESDPRENYIWTVCVKLFLPANEDARAGKVILRNCRMCV